MESSSIYLTTLIVLVWTSWSKSSIFQFLMSNTHNVVICVVGFSVVDKGCCGIGRNQGQISCLPLSIPCLNRDQHVFWDAFHPTEAANQIIARRAYSGPPSDCYPINVKEMAEVWFFNYIIINSSLTWIIIIINCILYLHKCLIKGIYAAMIYHSLLYHPCANFTYKDGWKCERTFRPYPVWLRINVTHLIRASVTLVWIW